MRVSARATFACLSVAAITWVASAGPSLSSCGTATDLLRDASFAVFPDPVERGRPFTITAAGDLASALSSGSVTIAIEAKVSVLGTKLVDDTVHEQVPFSFEPGFAAGPNKFVVGPMTLPGDLPASADVTGKVVILDSQGAQVTCIALDLHVVLSQASGSPPERMPLAAMSSCAKPSDHMRGITVTNSSGQLRFNASLDEDIAQTTFAADLKVKYGFIHVPLQLELPVAYFPGLKKGPISATVGPVNGTKAHGPRGALAMVTGQVVWKDAAAEEIACLSLEQAAGPALVV